MIRSDESPLKPAGDWKHRNLGERMEACRAMLYIHGALTEKENSIVRRRIAKWFKEFRDYPVEPIS